MGYWLSVVVQTPAHSGVGGALTYVSEQALAPGSLVRVPLGKRELLGVVWNCTDQAPPDTEGMQLRSVAGQLEGITPLGSDWRDLITFAASYYQRAIGEVALAALPPQLRDLSPVQMARRIKKTAIAASEVDSAGEKNASNEAEESATPELTPEQAVALDDIRENAGPFLLFGATGSGKTEVYLRAVADVLRNDPDAQALVMVPEINLTPQLQERFVARFKSENVVALHSGMTNPQRLKSWLAAHSGNARIVLGTRMAIFASMPNLKLIVVDEEHDPSYKQQEGARYSARDLAVYRASTSPIGCKVMLGSATPSLETWHHSRDKKDGGRYMRLSMPSRIGAGELPKVRLVDMNLQPPYTVFSTYLVDAISQRVARGEQVMVFLNRRGYAPVLHCGSCGWKSECPNCSAYRVFHKIDRTLRCHHCGFTERVPRACPTCGNMDIAPLGRGTERLEEQLAELLADVKRPDGSSPRIARIDADTTRAKGSLEVQLAQVHGGEVDVLVGTQMIAKGHDFRRITLVAAVNADSALYSSDFRAPERLFSLLMQAGGRAGRDAEYIAAQQSPSEMWIQTSHPTHPLFDALKKHDYPEFANRELQDRQLAGMPPFSFQALVRAEARSQEDAQAFLKLASEAAQGLGDFEHVTLYPPVPMTIQRVANVERAQMLIESGSRKALQRFLSEWHEILMSSRDRSVIRWAVDVDPLAI